MKPRTPSRNDTDDGQHRLAVLIDADNAQPTVIEGLLAEIAKYGVASVKRIYGDFTSTRMTRGVDGQSLNTRGLFPAGEGAGYAGGILSAGVDGIRAAEAVAMQMVAAGMAKAT